MSPLGIASLCGSAITAAITVVLLVRSPRKLYAVDYAAWSFVGTVVGLGLPYIFPLLIPGAAAYLIRRGRRRAEERAKERAAAPPEAEALPLCERCGFPTKKGPLR